MVQIPLARVHRHAGRVKNAIVPPHRMRGSAGAPLLCWLAIASSACHTPEAAPADRDPAAALRQILELVDREYVRDVPADRLAAVGRDAMLASLDPYATYFDAATYADLNTALAGSFGGIGMRIDFDAARKVYFVRGPLLGSPALAAGVRANDVIESIDGEAIASRTMDEVLARLRGEIGREVALGVRRGDERLSLRVARAEIPVTTVRGWWRDDAGQAQHRLPGSDLAYLRIRYFGPTTAVEVERAVKAIAASGARGIVLDLRHGPGGLLRAAIDIADLFLEQGAIVTLVRRGGAAEERRATPGVATDLPLAILVDRETRSASEVLAASLQDHHRAVVVGERSFGKGSVQKLFPVAGGGAIRLTVEHYLPPSGRPIERHFPDSDPAVGGVWPDQGWALELAAADVTKVGEALLHEDEEIGVVGMPSLAVPVASDRVVAKACEALAAAAPKK